MKANKLMSPILSVAAAALLSVGCASLGIGNKSEDSQVAKMKNSERIPSAQGEVAASEEANGNTKVNVNVKHLAHPDAVAAKASTYVVWAQESSDSRAQNLGALRVDKDLSGKLEAITPLKEFQIFITPEASAMVSKPSGDPDLWADINL